MQTTMKYILFTLFLFISVMISGQNQPKIITEVTPKTIRIGEQIEYKISVEDFDNQQVTFPKGQTFSPLELLSEKAIDTFRNAQKRRMVKTYFLTHFDSGSYIIPSQQIAIGKAFFNTDTLHIRVQDVAVDTLKQPLFGIKPIISVEKPTSNTLWVWILGILFLIILALVYFVFIRKKKLSEEEKIALLPPFDRAILGLKNLQNSKYLIESKHKEYYSELTDIIRRYLEEEVHISATESTTNELITKMELLLDSQKLNLPREVISDFKSVLQKSDLVKFAKSQPHDYEAQNDLQIIENVVIKTKEALPEPSEEEKIQDETYLWEKKQKIRKKYTQWAVALVVTLILLGSGGFFLYKHFQKGTPAYYLEQNDWITSVYDFPPLKITTPKVLERQEKDVQFFFAENQFVMGEEEKFAMKLLRMDTAGLPVFSENEEENPNLILEMVQFLIEKLYNAKNILTKPKEYNFPSGIKGTKISGGFEYEKENAVRKLFFETYLIGQGEALYLVLFFFGEATPEAEKLTEKIINSVEFVQ